MTKTSEFRAVYRLGRSWPEKRLVLFALPTPAHPDRVRVGYSVSKKLGGAVVRNRVKRLLREAARRLEGEFPPGHDVVFVARYPLRDAGKLEDAAESMRKVLQRAGRNGKKDNHCCSQNL